MTFKWDVWIKISELYTFNNIRESNIKNIIIGSSFVLDDEQTIIIPFRSENICEVLWILSENISLEISMGGTRHW